jgi:hypothetical protein
MIAMLGAYREQMRSIWHWQGFPFQYQKIAPSLLEDGKSFFHLDSRPMSRLVTIDKTNPEKARFRRIS